jgi:hypothetical protein
LEEGGVFQPSWGSKRVLANGKLQGIELVRCTRVFDDAGRFNPSFGPSVATVIEADTVILAIGQSTDFSFLADAAQSLVTDRGTLRIDETTLATPVAGVLAGVEAVTGRSSVIQAIATARRRRLQLTASSAVMVSLMKRLPPRWSRTHESTARENFASLRRESMPYLSLAERQKSFETIELGYDESMALREARRCLR